MYAKNESKNVFKKIEIEQGFDYGIEINNHDLSLTDVIKYGKMGEKLAAGEIVELGAANTAVNQLLAIVLAQQRIIAQFQLKTEKRGNPYADKRTQGYGMRKPRLRSL